MPDTEDLPQLIARMIGPFGVDNRKSIQKALVAHGAAVEQHLIYQNPNPHVAEVLGRLGEFGRWAI